MLLEVASFWPCNPQSSRSPFQDSLSVIPGGVRNHQETSNSVWPVGDQRHKIQDMGMLENVRGFPETPGTSGLAPKHVRHAVPTISGICANNP